MDIKKAMERNRLEKTNSLLGGFGLEKGKPAAMGEERVHGGVKVKKTPQGWVPVGSGKEKATPEKKAAPGSKKPEPASKTSSPVASQPGGAKPAAPAGGKPPVPGAAKPAGQPGGQEQPQVGGHEIAQLTHIKTVLKTDPAKAYEIYQSLTPEAQAVVPQEIVNKLVATAHKPVEEDKVDFNKLDKKPAEKKTEVKKEKPAEKKEGREKKGMSSKEKEIKLRKLAKEVNYRELLDEHAPESVENLPDLDKYVNEWLDSGGIDEEYLTPEKLKEDIINYAKRL